VDRIQPNRVQLNTVTRPPAEKEAGTVAPVQLQEFCSFFQPEAEVIADFRGVHQKAEFAADRKEVLEMLQRRPCSVEDIAGGLGMHQNEVVKHLEELRSGGMIAATRSGDKQFYMAVHES
jgi:wyosine [tRNA(Phe)-imidazoG37] synthetase (radical SAM superfamily)